MFSRIDQSLHIRSVFNLDSLKYEISNVVLCLFTRVIAVLFNFRNIYFVYRVFPLSFSIDSAVSISVGGASLKIRGGGSRDVLLTSWNARLFPSLPMGIGLSSSGKIVLLAARLAATFAHFPFFFRCGVSVILSFERVATIFRRANNASVGHSRLRNKWNCCRSWPPSPSRKHSD